MLFSPTQAAELQVGDAAPDFALVDQNGQIHELADYAGQWVVVYFYPKDDTPGCTTQACEFRDDVVQFRQLGARLLGVSLDSQRSHRRFAEKHGLPFPLLADTNGSVAKAYGSLMGFGPVKLAKRHTFVIAPDGRIAKIYRSVDPKRHSDAVIADLRTLMGEAPS
jgi:peroxiredoxin Q/BCP